MRYAGLNLTGKGLIFCMCLILSGSLSPRFRCDDRAAVRAGKVPSNVWNGSHRRVADEKGGAVAGVHGNPPVSLVADRKLLNGEAAFCRTGSVRTALFSHNWIVPGLQESRASVRKIDFEATTQKALNTNPPMARASEGHASYLRVKTLGMNGGADVIGKDAPPGKSENLNARQKPHTDIPTCKTSIYHDALSDVAIKAHVTNSQPQRDAILRHRAIPSAVRHHRISEKDEPVIGVVYLASERGARRRNLSVNPGLKIGPMGRWFIR